jgi:hypothetical protein
MNCQILHLQHPKLHPESVCDFVDNYVHKGQSPRHTVLSQECLQNDQNGNLSPPVPLYPL